MRVKYLATAAFAAFVAASLGSFSPTAQAASNDGSRDFHGRQYQSLNTEEQNTWQHGKWVHDWHDGHYAWWWSVGDFWYFYDRPTFPYPRAVSSFAMTGHAPPVTVGDVTGPSWFYCEQSGGYSPYVTSCAGNWHQVAIAPSTVAAE
jgi:hypothetical protein